MAGTTADKLQAILNSKAAIKTAINNKGGTITDSTPLDEYATAINNIPTADSILDGSATSIKSNVTTLMNYMFYNNNVIEELEFTNLQTINQSYVLYNCSKLETLSFPELLAVSSSIFYNIGVTEINDTMFPKLEIISSGGFNSNSKLTSATLSNLTTLTSANIFLSCPKLELLDLSSCSFTGVGNIMRGSSQSVTDGCVLKLPATCNSVGALALVNARLKEVWLYNPNQIVSMVAGGLAQAQSTGNPIAVYVPNDILATYQADSTFTTLVNNNKVTLNAIPS